MTERVPFSTYTEALAARARDTPGLQAVVLLGSASEAGSELRDSWSDHDFYALLEPGREFDLRRSLPFLPQQDRIVLIAREGERGFSVLYDDGHLFEFGVGTVDEIGAVRLSRFQVLADTADAGAAFAAAAVRRATLPTDETAADAAGLALVKLLIGYGRAVRGEIVSGGVFVRHHAVHWFAVAIRHRSPAKAAWADPFDPLRRFERDHPDIAREIATALEAPVPQAARRLFALIRARLEPDWPDFPSAAADVVAARLDEE